MGNKPSLPPRGAWIEILESRKDKSAWESLPPRGAWIEITNYRCFVAEWGVAPPTGSVD